MKLLNNQLVACFIGAIIFTLIPSLSLALIFALKGSILTWSDLVIWGLTIIFQWVLFYGIFRNYK